MLPRVKAHQALQRLVNFMECEPNGETVIVCGNYSIGATFDRAGKCLDMSGTRDWPDYIGDESKWEKYPPVTRGDQEPIVS